MPFHYGNGYTRDEMYFIAMSSHIGWGYVDVPPLCPFLLSIVRSVLGTSLFSVHLLSSISGAIVIFLTYKMVKIFEGDFLACALAIIPVTFMAISFGYMFTYDTFDFLLWTVMIYCLIVLFKTEQRKWWIYFGIAAGFALLTKITIVFFGLGIVISLILTKERKNFKYIQFWLAGLIAILIFSPYIIWNYCHGFPTLEFFRNYAENKLMPMSALFYIKYQFQIFLPIFPLIVLGICYFIFYKKGKKFFVLGLAYIVILVICIFENSRPNIIFSYYPVLFAGGGVLLSSLIKNSKILLFFKIIYLLIILAFCVYLIPLVRPILPLNTFIKYYCTHTAEKTLSEHKNGILPPQYSARFGWSELAEKVAKVYNSLPPKQRAETAIFTNNYGEAGAISIFGKKYGLPDPISGHNQYFIWGPKNYTGKSMIFVTGSYYTNGTLNNMFKSVKVMARTDNQYCIPYENHLYICLCTEPKFKSLKSIWKNLKNFS